VKDEELAKLTRSVKQAGRIRRGAQQPSRVFDFQPDDIKAIRERLGKSQVELASLIGVPPRCATGSKVEGAPRGRRARS
jgi:DNA-binding transcriptional regulator YiaG